MYSDNVKWLAYLVPKDGGGAFEECIEAISLVEAVNIINNTYGLEYFEEFDIRRLIG